MDGLRITFDHVVELQLLYAAEREQHGRLLRPGSPGAEGRARSRHASARSDRTGEGVPDWGGAILVHPPSTKVEGSGTRGFLSCLTGGTVSPC